MLAEHAFSLGVKRVAAYVNVGNVASENVLPRAGFTREGVVRSLPKPDGRRVDKTLYSLLPRRVKGRAPRLLGVKIFNLHGDNWDRTEDREGWRSKDAWVGAHIGAELIGGSMYELEPGDRLWPYHTHHANEEWLIVLRGEPTLRTPEGEQALSEGDVVCFPRGKDGAHQVGNRTDSPIRVLMLSTLVAPDIVEYLDSGKIGARSVKGERILLSRPGPLLEYWEGED
jgi:uncharacterized cupin superfamily protein